MKRLILIACMTALATPAALAQTLSVTRELTFDARAYFAGQGSGGSTVTFADERYIFVDRSSLVVPAGTYDRVELTFAAPAGQRFEIAPTPVPAALKFDVLWNSPIASGGVDPNQPIDVAFLAGTPGLPTSGFGGFTLGNASSLFAVANQDGIVLPAGGSTFEAFTFGQDIAPTLFTVDTELGLVFGEVDFEYTVFDQELPDPGPFTSIVPEPTSLALLAFGGLLVAPRRRL